MNTINAYRCFYDMKLKYLLILGCGLLFSCTSDSNKMKLNSDSLKMDSADAKFLIVPGKSIGKFYLGQNVVEIDSILGKADFSDAAMGKAWSIWYRGDTSRFRKREIAIYSSYADSTMKWKSVKQIRVNSNKVTTVTGLNNGNLLSSFTAKYTDFKKVASFVNANLGDTILLYDSKSNGIAAEFIRDISRAIIIHKKGEQVNQTYLTLHPEWKILK